MRINPDVITNFQEGEKNKQENNMVVSPNRAFKQIITTFYNEEIKAIDANPGNFERERKDSIRTKDYI